MDPVAEVSSKSWELHTVVLNPEPHPDHAGGLGVLQQEPGADLWASEASAYIDSAEAELRSGLLHQAGLAASGNRPPLETDGAHVISVKPLESGTEIGRFISRSTACVTRR